MGLLDTPCGDLTMAATETINDRALGNDGIRPFPGIIWPGKPGAFLPQIL